MVKVMFRSSMRLNFLLYFIRRTFSTHGYFDFKAPIRCIRNKDIPFVENINGQQLTKTVLVICQQDENLSIFSQSP